MYYLLVILVSLVLPFVTAQNAYGKSNQVSFINSFHQLLLDTGLILSEPTPKSTEQTFTKTLHPIHHKHHLKKRNHRLHLNATISKHPAPVVTKDIVHTYKNGTNKSSEWKEKYDTTRANEFWIDFERG